MKKYIIAIITGSLNIILGINMLFAATNTWTQKADFGGSARHGAVGFSIGSKGYIGTGADPSAKKDFWEYNPAANTWTQKADFGGSARQEVVGFSIGSKGYIGTGHNGSSYEKDFWEYDSSSGQISSNPALYFPHIDTSLPWQTEIALINTSDQAITGTLEGISDEGQLIETKTVTLGAHGRRQITIANEFTNHTDIGYIIFDTTSDSVQGYTKFYQAGIYRAAIPAVKVKEVNSSDIYISHIDQGALWWTGVSLVNTTSARKDLVITFNTGQSVPYTLNANEHKAFTIAGLFNNQPQPNIKSAVISNASGVIGLELFGSIGSGNQMDGILLTDKTTSTIYYPHVASDSTWWTGIVAYNPSASAATITITPYSAQGTSLTPSTLSIAGKGKYVGLVSALGLPDNTAWFKIDSTTPLSGFELFATWDGQQLGAYAGGGTGAKAGIFPKIEKSGWTGIAFVNTEPTAAFVTLTAFNDNGAVIATQTLFVGGYAKVVNYAESIFTQTISSATYIAYSSDRNVLGFQLNGSSDGKMLDGLPGLEGGSTICLGCTPEVYLKAKAQALLPTLLYQQFDQLLAEISTDQNYGLFVSDASQALDDLNTAYQQQQAESRALFNTDKTAKRALTAQAFPDLWSALNKETEVLTSAFGDLMHEGAQAMRAAGMGYGTGYLGGKSYALSFQNGVGGELFLMNGAGGEAIYDFLNQTKYEVQVEMCNEGAGITLGAVGGGLSLDGATLFTEKLIFGNKLHDVPAAGSSKSLSISAGVAPNVIIKHVGLNASVGGFKGYKGLCKPDATGLLCMHAQGEESGIYGVSATLGLKGGGILGAIAGLKVSLDVGGTTSCKGEPVNTVNFQDTIQALRAPNAKARRFQASIQSAIDILREQSIFGVPLPSATTSLAVAASLCYGLINNGASITGVVTYNGSPLSSVGMSLLGGTEQYVRTGADGVYEFSGLSNGSYTITPALRGYAFTPSSLSVTVNGADQTGKNFTATPVVTTYSISGTVTWAGAGLSGVTMTLTGAGSGTATTDSSGNYTISGVANGSYTITPTKSGYTFTPNSRTVTVNGANQTSMNFTATLSPPSDPWTQKKDFGGTSRYGAVGFSIGSKGYIGTGYDGSIKKDFWEYDSVTNTWTQKADFGGTARFRAFGFSIGNKGYIGMGAITESGTAYTNSLWEYNSDTSAWTQKTNFKGSARYVSVGFSIGTKGYIGTGYDGSTGKRDFWEYDPATDTWTQKADFGGTARQDAVGFSIDTKGYIGTGYDGSLKKDFWEYNPATNAWTKKADFGGTPRQNAVGFSIGSKGYIGTGADPSATKDFWEYDASADTWTKKTDLKGSARYEAVGFSIGTKGYIGTGYNGSNTFWEYDPSADQ